jgi:L-iditol 2-dehydrogenase
MQKTNGTGADCIIETSGSASAIAGCVGLLKKNGYIIGTGIPFDNNIPFPWREAVLRSLSIRFNMSTSYTSWDKALCYLQQDSELLGKIITWSGDINEWERIFNELLQEKQQKAMFVF